MATLGHPRNSIQIMPFHGGLGKSIARLNAESNLVFSSDDSQLIASSKGGNVIAWNIASDEEKFAFKSPCSVNCVALSPDGRQIATGGSDNTIRIWNIRTGEEVHAIKGHYSEIWSLSYNRDESMLASGSADSVKLWSLDSLEGDVHLPDRRIGSDFLAFSPIANQVASRSGRDIVLSNPWLTGTDNAMVLKGIGRYGPVVYSHDGRLLACTDDKNVIIYNFADQTIISTFASHSGAVGSVAFSHDGALVASGDSHFGVYLWNTSNGETVKKLEKRSTIGSDSTKVAFTPSGEHLVTVCGYDGVQLWNARSGEAVATICDESLGFISCALSADGKLLGTGSRRGTVHLWRLLDRQEAYRLDGHSGPIACLAFSPDCQRLAAGGDKVEIWDLTTRETVLSLPGPTDNLSFSHDGRILAGGKHLWNATTRNKLQNE
jgi:WD40 repeat protein